MPGSLPIGPAPEVSLPNKMKNLPAKLEQVLKILIPAELKLVPVVVHDPQTGAIAAVVLAAEEVALQIVQALAAPAAPVAAV